MPTAGNDHADAEHYAAHHGGQADGHDVALAGMEPVVKKLPYLMAQKPMLVMAKAMSTARVTEVEPVMQGSRKDAVKQNATFAG